MKLNHERAVDVICLLIILMLLAGFKAIINDRDREIQAMINNNEELMLQMDDLRHQLDIYKEILIKEKQTIQELLEEIEKLRVIRARITAYSPFDDRNGINSDSNPEVTATGKRPSRKYAAADPKRLPYGTKLYVPNYGEVEIQDTGAAMRNYEGLAIDVFQKTYEMAMEFGVQELDVVIQRR